MQLLKLLLELAGKPTVEYEQCGNDRAQYGAKLLPNIVSRVKIKGINTTLLANARNFYLYYPQIIDVIAPIFPMLSEKLKDYPLPLELPINGAAKIFPTASDKFITPASSLISNLSFSHIVELLTVEDPLIRFLYLSQLNAYVSYYRENEMHPGDNPPVGILLCTRKGTRMVEYALAGMDSSLFVSTYQLCLPDKKQLENFLHNAID